MPRPPGMTDAQYRQYVHERATQKMQAEMYERIEREGFESTSYDAADGETCIRRRSKKVRNRWCIEPCRAEAYIGLVFRTPENPAGMRIPLCRPCLVAELKDLMGYLD